MRRLILLGLLAVMAIPAGAAKPDAITQVTVAQLGQALIEASAKHKSDGAIARQIGGMELKERLTEATLARLSANLKAGSKTALALQLLADQSTFLDPPASELPAIPAPDDATQKQMFAAARNYLSQTVQHLPNFLATRTDNRFDNSRRSQDNDTGLYRVGNSSREVSIRNDRETSVGDQMASWGEFGAMLGMVLNDAAWVTWSHWEQTPAGPVAVFRYFVPKAASHFVVYIPVLEQSTLKDREQPSDLMSGFGNPEASLQAYHPNDSNNSVITAKPGYRGLLWLDPSTGTVLRITMEADPSDIAPYERAAMMVQYGPVKIGDGNFTCPVRSLSILRLSPKSVTANTSDQTCRMKGQMGPGGGIPDCESEGSGTKVPPTLWLNETLFTGYHRFAATTQILSDGAAPKSEPTHDEGSQPPKPAEEVSTPATSAVQPQPVGQETEQDVNLKPANSTPAIPQGATPDRAEESPAKQPGSAETASQAMTLFDQKNYALAGPLFDQACGGGSGPACNLLGWMYQNKLGVNQDYPQAVKLYTKACDAGDASGCNNLGLMYQNKLGVKRDYAQAVKLYIKVCDAGNVSGCNDLGIMYQNGWGVKEDAPRAVQLYTKACDAGNASGCNGLGIMYQNGWGVRQDYPLAAQLFTKACDAGSANGCTDLGYLYLGAGGSRVARDNDKGKQFLKKGCDMGDQRGCDMLKQIEIMEEGLAR